jgi:hypothetical protein
MSISYPALGTPAVGAAAITTVVAVTTNAVLSLSNPLRAPEALIINNSNKNLWVTISGAAATVTPPSIKVPALGGSFDIPAGYTGTINGIWEPGGVAITGSAVVYECSYV